MQLLRELQLCDVAARLWSHFVAVTCQHQQLEQTHAPDAAAAAEATMQQPRCLRLCTDPHAFLENASCMKPAGAGQNSARRGPSKVADGGLCCCMHAGSGGKGCMCLVGYLPTAVAAAAKPAYTAAGALSWFALWHVRPPLHSMQASPMAVGTGSKRTWVYPCRQPCSGDSDCSERLLLVSKRWGGHVSM